MAFLLTLAWIDLRTRLLPNVLVYRGTAGAALAVPLLPADGYVSAFIGGGLGFLVFAVVFFASPGVLGGDDVKLAVAIGLALGVPTASTR